MLQSTARGGNESRRPLSRWRRGGEIAGWIVPGTMLALMPKCPICLAAYVALATGIGLSLPVAAVLRTALLVVCVLSLGFVVGRRVWRFSKAKG